MPRTATAKKPAARKTREAWGSATPLPSGRVRARYTGPDLAHYNAPTTFDTLDDARAWLREERKLIDSGLWTPPSARAARERATVLTLGQYAASWLPERTLAPRTRDLYAGLLERALLPTEIAPGTPLSDVPLDAIKPATIRKWYGSLNASTPTARAHAYSLLRTILNTAYADDLIETNPCRIRGAGYAKRVRSINIATAREVEDILRRIPERYRMVVLLGIWCAFRWGELSELRRKDVNLKTGVISVTRAVGKVKDPENPGHRVWIVGPPKSAAGVRDVAMPKFLLPLLKEHMQHHSQWGKDGLLFPSFEANTWMEHGMFHDNFDKARRAAGRPDLRIHDLRHTGATLAARNGATLKELMARIGHSTPNAALLYQHAASERDQAIASGLDNIAKAGNF